MQTGKQIFLAAFDRLFDRALSKIGSPCTPEEKADVTRRFAERYDEVLDFLDGVDVAEFSEASLARMESAIDDVSVADLAGLLAAGPLAVEIQETMRAIALRSAEQRLIEHFAGQADDSYGGN